MHNTKDKTLVEMACGYSPVNEEYYTKALQEISQNRGCFWNWYAALFHGLWLLYHKMFAELYILLLLNALLLKVFPSLLIFFLEFVFWGLWGNNLLFNSLKRKINTGYFLIPGYETTEGICILEGICICVTTCGHYLVCMICGIEITGFRSDGRISLIFACIPMLIYITIKIIIVPIRDRWRAWTYKKLYERESSSHKNS